jgi:plasmid maintenance system antidote protein VapI
LTFARCGRHGAQATWQGEQPQKATGQRAEFWLNAQRSVDLWDAAQAIGKEMARIKSLRVA